MTARSPVSPPFTTSTTLPPPTTPPEFDASKNQRGRPHSHIGLLTSTPSPLPGTSDNTSDSQLEGLRIARKPSISPGLLARLRALDKTKSRVVSSPALLQEKIGRIPESQLRELDNLHRDHSIIITRRGQRVRSGSHPRLEPQLTGGSLPAMDHDLPPGFESDHSSVVSTSDRILPSDSEQDDTPDTFGEETQKYRLPDLTKTKSLSQPVTETENSSQHDTSQPPTPPPKDVPRNQQTSDVNGSDNEEQIDVESYFARRSHIARANSIYTLSRVSFTNQIQQLTSITLPQASSLSSSISAIPTSTAAGRALHDAAGQIKLWMAKASEVLNGLDAEDDVEWAAAAGREGLAEVDAAIGRFESLVTVYITAIEELQSRLDISSLPAKDLQRLVAQMDEVVRDWQKIKQTLKGIKSQVEIAMEWEELWNTVLGEIGLEIENLSRLVFEMEERRHRAITESVTESAEKFDIAELETIVEEYPRQARANNRFSLPPSFSVSSPISPIPQIEQENSKLLALFARMQPLRASLDFLPMRLSSFQHRANKVFPTACEELNRRKDTLEKQEKKLESDADALREELGEDKWVHSFRQAGSKALAMWTSLNKSIRKLRQAIEEADDEKVSTRISTYKDKRQHYPPSMRRVLELIDIEMKNRSTVNGEILRIQADVRQKVTELEFQTTEMDAMLEEYSSNRKLRDSVSTILSSRTDLSMANSAIDTPGSSPASSVILMSRKSSDQGPATPNVVRQSRKVSFGGTPTSSVPTNKRYSSLPTSVSGVSHIPRKSLGSRLDLISSSSPTRESIYTPGSSVRSSTPRSDKSDTSKPRWNSSTNMRDTVVGHNFKPLSATTPSPHAKVPTPVRTLRSASSYSAIPVRSPLSRSSALSPPPSNAVRPPSATPGQQSSANKRLSHIQSPSTPPRSPGSTIRAAAPGSNLSSGAAGSGRRLSPMREPQEGEEDGEVEEPIDESPSARPKPARPTSSMNSRRSSMLPQPKGRTASGNGRESLIGGGRDSYISSGRDSRIGGRISSVGGAIAASDDKPRWRG